MSPTYLDLAALCLAAIAGGAVNAVAGGGTLITFPALLAAGVPALHANITNTVALVPGYAGGAAAQRGDLAGQRRVVTVAAVPAAVGGLVGALLLMLTGEALFRALVPWLILTATVLLACEPRMKAFAARRLGSSLAGGDALDAEGGPAARGADLAPVGLVVFTGAVYGGYFGAGLGIILLALLSLVLREPLARVNALKQVLSLLANVAAAALFAASGSVVWSAAAVMAVGALFGGWLGGRFAGRVPAPVLRRVVVALGIIVAVVYLVR